MSTMVVHYWGNTMRMLMTNGVCRSRCGGRVPAGLGVVCSSGGSDGRHSKKRTRPRRGRRKKDDDVVVTRRRWYHSSRSGDGRDTKPRYSSSSPHGDAGSSLYDKAGTVMMKEARIIEDSDHGIRDHCIIPEAWHVLMGLRKHGHEAYVVGGTVRDVLMQQQVPKDVDILTSADPSQVARLFKRSFLLGRNFPICHVHVGRGHVIEVSSFSTNADPAHIPLDYATLAAYASRSKYVDSTGGGVFAGGPTWAMARRENAIKRDFTMNALLYDPFTRILFDYVGGVEDCETKTLRTIESPDVSFSSDPARMLRALRLAARLGLRIDEDTKREILARRTDITSLSHGRLQMELNAMMAHGSAAESFSLLAAYGMMELMLPHHAEVDRDVITSMLSRMDAYARVDAPVDSIFWTTMLFAPLCLHREDAVASDTTHTSAGREDIDSVSQRLLSSDNTTIPCLLPRNAVEMAATILKLHRDTVSQDAMLPSISADEYIQERRNAHKKRRNKARKKTTIKGLNSTEIVILNILRDYI
ncbi:Poly(A) polymerase I [Picochlorum sp. SENEW3]|nr:Poly(A) polymerase I [Picochlorum sp. SENEW3]